MARFLRVLAILLMLGLIVAAAASYTSASGETEPPNATKSEPPCTTRRSEASQDTAQSVHDKGFWTNLLGR